MTNLSKQKNKSRADGENKTMADKPRYLPKSCTKIFDLGKLLKFCGETVQIS